MPQPPPASRRVRGPGSPRRRRPLPKLRVNLSPAAATRSLAALGLGVAVCATVAATLALVTSRSGVGMRVTRAHPRAAHRVARVDAVAVPGGHALCDLAHRSAGASRGRARVDRPVAWRGCPGRVAGVGRRRGRTVCSPLVRVGGFITLLGSSACCCAISVRPSRARCGCRLPAGWSAGWPSRSARS